MRLFLDKANFILLTIYSGAKRRVLYFLLITNFARLLHVIGNRVCWALKVGVANRNRVMFRKVHTSVFCKRDDTGMASRAHRQKGSIKLDEQVIDEADKTE